VLAVSDRTGQPVDHGREDVPLAVELR
jgi:hypothetical protein